MDACFALLVVAAIALERKEWACVDLTLDAVSLLSAIPVWGGFVWYGRVAWLHSFCLSFLIMILSSFPAFLYVLVASIR